MLLQSEPVVGPMSAEINGNSRRVKPATRHTALQPAHAKREFAWEARRPGVKGGRTIWTEFLHLWEIVL